jgi:hypothetical protein
MESVITIEQYINGEYKTVWGGVLRKLLNYGPNQYDDYQLISGILRGIFLKFRDRVPDDFIIASCWAINWKYGKLSIEERLKKLSLILSQFIEFNVPGKEEITKMVLLLWI